MMITLNTAKVEYVGLVSDEVNWITFDDGVRITLTIEQLNGIVEHYERALDRKEMLAQLGN